MHSENCSIAPPIVLPALIPALLSQKKSIFSCCMYSLVLLWIDSLISLWINCHYVFYYEWAMQILFYRCKQQASDRAFLVILTCNWTVLCFYALCTSMFLSPRLYIFKHSGWRALAEILSLYHRPLFCVPVYCTPFSVLYTFQCAECCSVALYKFTYAFTYPSVFFQVFSWAFQEAMLLLHTVKMYLNCSHFSNWSPVLQIALALLVFHEIGCSLHMSECCLWTTVQLSASRWLLNSSWSSWTSWKPPICNLTRQPPRMVKERTKTSSFLNLHNGASQT